VTWPEVHEVRSFQLFPAYTHCRALGLQTGGTITAKRSTKRGIPSRKRESPLGSEDRYRKVFQHSAVSLWEEDISELRSAFAELRSRGVTDLGGYLSAHPAFLVEAVHLIDVVDVNDATLRLLEVESRERLLGSLDKTLDLEQPVLAEGMAGRIIAIWEGASYHEGESMAETPSGRRLTLAVTASIPPVPDESACMLVPCS
jgi:PAS domain-containing protein